MSIQYFDEKKKQWFPKIKDWSANQNKLRYEKDIQGMDFYSWFWYHHTSYSLIHYGSNIIFILTFGILGVYLLLKGWDFIPYLLLAFTLWSILNLGKKISERKYTKGMNFYDVFLRE